MATIGSEGLKLAGNYLLGLLRLEGKVRYARFYDGTEATALALRKAVGWPKQEDDEDEPNPSLVEGYDVDDELEICLDLAVEQLERAGIVIMRETDDILADGTQDYEIAITDRGKAFLASGKEFEFQSMEL